MEVTGSDLLDRPDSVFCEKGFGVDACTLECGDVIGSPAIAEGDADVSEEAFAFDAFDRAPFERVAKRFIVERKKISEVGVF